MLELFHVLFVFGLLSVEERDLQVLEKVVVVLILEFSIPIRFSSSPSAPLIESFLPTKECGQLALQENQPCFDMQAFRCPSCDNEQSSVHAHVATSEFLMNFRTHQICLL